MGTVVSFFFVPAGGWVADKFQDNRPVVMLVSALVQTACPLINAFWPTFTFVVLTPRLAIRSCSWDPV